MSPRHNHDRNATASSDCTLSRWAARSPEARADSTPQLEIYADDVKCTHGSTVGPLDPTALYYLQSRGLSPETARSLLTYGFAAEILGRMQRADLRERCDRLVRAELA